MVLGTAFPIIADMMYNAAFDVKLTCSRAMVNDTIIECSYAGNLNVILTGGLTEELKEVPKIILNTAEEVTVADITTIGPGNTSTGW
jgi:hypothetical protein